MEEFKYWGWEEAEPDDKERGVLVYIKTDAGEGDTLAQLVDETGEDWTPEDLRGHCNLICAAPELLEALERVVGCHVPKINPFSDAAVLSAQAIIKKAKGA